MSQISAIFGTDNDEEILDSLYLIANVSPKFCLLIPLCHQLYNCLEHERPRADPRIHRHLQHHVLHTALVRMGEQLLCRNAS